MFWKIWKYDEAIHSFPTTKLLKHLIQSADSSFCGTIQRTVTALKSCSFGVSYTRKGLESYPLWASKTTTSCNIHEPHSSGWAKHRMQLEASSIQRIPYWTHRVIGKTRPPCHGVEISGLCGGAAKTKIDCSDRQNAESQIGLSNQCLYHKEPTATDMERATSSCASVGLSDLAT